MRTHAHLGVAAVLLLVAGLVVRKEASGAERSGSIYVGPQAAVVDGGSEGRLALAGAMLGWQPFRDQRDADTFSLEFSASKPLGHAEGVVYAVDLLLGPIRWGDVPFHLRLGGGRVSEESAAFAEVLLGARLRIREVVVRPEVGLSLWAAAGGFPFGGPTARLGVEYHIM
jgi:hypothetical protein